MKRLIVCALMLVLYRGGSVPALALSLEELDAGLPGSGTAPPGVTSWDLLGKASVLFTEENGTEKVTIVIPPEVEAIDGRQIKLMGFMFPVEAETPTRQFLLVEYPADCPFCLAAGTEPSRIVEVNTAEGMDWHDDQVVVSGRLEVVHDDENGLVYRLRQARLAE
jgi:uncharacterized protein